MKIYVYIRIDCRLYRPAAQPHTPGSNKISDDGSGTGWNWTASAGIVIDCVKFAASTTP